MQSDPQVPERDTSLPEDETESFLRRHGHKLLALLFWVALFGAYQWYATQNNLSPAEAARRLVDLLSTSIYGPALYLGIYVLRPLALWPAWILTVLGGFLFGPILGGVYVVVGSNTSATVAYLVGRFFGNDVLEEEEAAAGIMQRYARRMRRNSFETVLLMRFLFVPYDVVNYLAGFLRIRWTPFIVATALGSLPGTLSFVLFGASIEGDLLSAGRPEIDPWVLATSVVIFVGSLLVSRYMKRRESARIDTEGAV